LFFIEQKRKGERKETLSKKGSSDSAQTGFGRRCAFAGKSLFRAILAGDLAIGHLQNGCSDLVHQGC
jgi:hypothetical protein